MMAFENLIVWTEIVTVGIFLYMFANTFPVKNLLY